MSAKHTPGPWTLEPVEDRSIKHLCPIDKDKLSLLTVVEQDGTAFAAVYNDADARLIAAAPDLLEALKYMLEVCPAINGQGEESHHQARAAIAKATGEQL